MSKPILIIKTGNTYKELRANQGDFEDWIQSKITSASREILTLKAYPQPKYPALKNLAGIIITGSHNDVTDQTPWMIHLKQYLKKTVNHNLPVLGICFGHQLLADSLGGSVGYNSHGGEFGLVKMQIKNTEKKDLVEDLSDEIYGYVSHSQSIEQLPEGAKVYAGNEVEPYHIVNFAKNIWGVQFHPEYNRKIAGFYYKKIKKQAFRCPKRVADTASLQGQTIFHNFIELCD